MYRFESKTEGLRCLIQPNGGKDTPAFPAQMVKGGTHVRGATENHPVSYPMFVLYAFVIIVLAAVFLL